MKGRYLSSFFAALVILLVSSIPAYSQNAVALIQGAIKQQRTKQVAKSTPPNKLNAGGNYVVRPGDSLYKIARTFNTTPRALISANRLRSSRIKIGQEIVIPAGAQNVATEAERTGTAKAALAPGGVSDYPTMSRLREDEQLAEGSNGSRRLQLVKAGFEMLGVRYRFSGMSEESGFDCSGLVKSLFSKFNIDLPRSSRDQFNHGQKVDREELEAGDLVFFSSGGKSPTHVGIYIGDNKFIHAARNARKVIISDLNKIWHTMRYLGARRILDLWEEEQQSAQKAKD